MRGPNHFNKYEVKATARVLNSISDMTKVLYSNLPVTRKHFPSQSPLQVVAQLTIILLRWKGESESSHYKRLASMAVHTFLLVYGMTGDQTENWQYFPKLTIISEHWFFQCSGKGQEELFSYTTAVRLPVFNLVHFTGNIYFQQYCNCNIVIPF